jgi:hypothetical protein
MIDGARGEVSSSDASDSFIEYSDTEFKTNYFRDY